MQIISLNLNKKTAIPVLCAKQGDVGRKFQVVFTDGIPECVTFSVWYSGASGEGNYTNIGDTSAFSVDGNTVTVELIAQMLINAGEGLLCLVMSGADGSQLGTWNIPYVAEAVPGVGSKPAGQYYQALRKLEEEAAAATETAKNAAQRVNEAVEEVETLGQSGEGDRAVTFNDPGNRTISKDTFAAGSGSMAGLKGFYWSQIDVSTGKIELSTVNGPYGQEQDFDLADYWAVGDTITIHSDSKWHNCSVIKTISGKTIIVDSLPFDEPTPFDGHYTCQAVYVLAKPDKGLVDLGGNAIAAGDECNATNYAATAFGARNNVYGQYGFAAGRDNVAGYAAAAFGRENVVFGEKGFSNGQENTVSGDNAGAIGEKNIVSGRCASAMGLENTASGSNAHAQGKRTVASGNRAHAEGEDSISTAQATHAEGLETQAGNDDGIGAGAHSEGYGSKATAQAAHAENRGTQATGKYAHSQGLYTIATGKAQHVAGRYNVPDTDIDSSEYGKYAEIVGGGTSNTKQKNIRTLDWSGNAIYAGKVYAEGGKELATAADLDEKTKLLWLNASPNSGFGELTVPLDLSNVSFVAVASIYGTIILQKGQMGVWGFHDPTNLYTRTVTVTDNGITFGECICNGDHAVNEIMVPQSIWKQG